MEPILAKIVRFVTIATFGHVGADNAMARVGNAGKLETKRAV